MLSILPLRATDATRLCAFASRRDVVRFGDHLPYSAPADGSRWIGTPAQTLALGAFEGDSLAAALVLWLPARRRLAHAARLHVLASAEPSADDAVEKLLDAAIDAADRWLGLARLELVCAADHPRVGGSFASRGFAVEVIKRGSLRRDGRAIDEAVLARVRLARLVDDPPATPVAPVPPVRASRRGDVTIRAAVPSDAEAFARLMSEPEVLWGTAQTPHQRPEAWSDRFASPAPGVTSLVAEVDGTLAAMAALLQPAEARRRHAASIALAVSTTFQGRGLGTRLLDELLALADDHLGLDRLELEVFDDNERAIRLYLSRGFVREGLRVRAVLRDGRYVDDLAMARVREA